MIRDTRFWILMGLFQVLFGLTTFGLTRDYYLNGGDRSGVGAATVPQTSNEPVPDLPRVKSASPSSTSPTSPAGSQPQGPAAIGLQADEAFANGQHERAAELYAQLLAFAPEDAEVHNNLGLTLYYSGRSAEALRILNAGIAINPAHQRIRLTLGYVNKQLGNDAAARDALVNATIIGDDQEIRKSAMEMLRDVP